jgi:hypothetical protein
MAVSLLNGDLCTDRQQCSWIAEGKARFANRLAEASELTWGADGIHKLERLIDFGGEIR